MLVHHCSCMWTDHVTHIILHENSSLLSLLYCSTTSGRKTSAPRLEKTADSIWLHLEWICKESQSTDRGTPCCSLTTSSVCRGLPGYNDSQHYGPEKKEKSRLRQCSVTYFHTSMPYSTHHVLQQCIVWFKQLRSVCVCLVCARWGREREGRTSTEQQLTSPGSR